jgi:hypothetical protein
MTSHGSRPTLHRQSLEVEDASTIETLVDRPGRARALYLGAVAG